MLERGRAYPVKKILTHHRTDEDEFFAIKLARMFGKEAFPDIRKAEVELIDAGLYGSDGDDLLEHYGILCIGVRGGQFDEHRPGGVRDGSAATRMTAWLGLENRHSINRMLAYSLRTDSGGISTSFEWGALVKAWWEAGFKLELITTLYDTAFEGLYHVLSEKPAKGRPRTTFNGLVATWLNKQKGDIEANPAFTQIIALHRGENVNPMFGIEAIWRGIFAAGMPPKVANDFVRWSLEAKHFEQLNFMKIKEELPKIALGVSHQKFKIMVAVTDSSQVLRAARKLKPTPDVLIQRYSDGHTLVHLTHRRPNLEHVATALSGAEQQKRGLPMTEQAFQWFPWREGKLTLGVFNGGPKTPNRQLTALTLEEVIGVVKIGLARTA